MKPISVYKAKPIERYAQLVGGCVLIACSLMMSNLTYEMRLLFVVFGVAGIGFGVFCHFHYPFKVFDEHLEARKTPVSPVTKITFSSIKSLHSQGASKVVIHHVQGGNTKKSSLYVGMLARGERDALIEQVDSRTSKDVRNSLKRAPS